MKTITDMHIVKTERPLRIVQFGEGNFLRAFVDEMIDIINEKTDFNGSIAVIKPRAKGSLEKFERQNGLYTVVLRGKEKGEAVCTHRIITAIDKTVSGVHYEEELAELACCPTVRFVVSNTTEAGIVLDENDSLNGIPETFPGKLTKFLYQRWQTFSGSSESGLIILPTELIEDNGTKLKAYILRLAEIWDLPREFSAWLENCCTFCNTLVDRIVTGFPSAEAEKLWEQLGYRDDLLDIGEPFGLWVIECERDISGELPLVQAGLPVVFTNDLKPYRECKVRVLNGAHTSSVLAGWLYGKSIVRDMMQDPITGAFVRQTVLEEIAPLVPLEKDEVEAFASAVFERFENPFIDHELLAISLNSVSKWKARVLPTIRDHYAKNGSLPRRLTFSFAALLAFYTADDLREDGLHAIRPDGTPYIVRDDRAVLTFFAEKSSLPAADFVEAVCGNTAFWGEDLRLYNGFVDTVTNHLNAIREDIQEALQNILQ